MLLLFNAGLGELRGEKAVTEIWLCGKKIISWAVKSTI